jgi:hypothetical protein
MFFDIWLMYLVFQLSIFSNVTPLLGFEIKSDDKMNEMTFITLFFIFYFIKNHICPYLKSKN